MEVSAGINDPLLRIHNTHYQSEVRRFKAINKKENNKKKRKEKQVSSL